MTSDVERARARLERNVLGKAAVRMVDVGRERDRTVLRVHVAPGTRVASLTLPRAVDGFPVRVIEADYTLQ
jgi:hypothetical protein